MPEKISEYVNELIYHGRGFSAVKYSLPTQGIEPQCFVNGELGPSGRVEKTSHVGRDEYGMDFIAPVGTIVYSPARGKIILLEQFYSEATHNPNDGNHVNQIVVRTSSNETYELKHIQHNACPLHVGDWVEEGQELTEVGLNGFYVADSGVEFPAHLHFAVHSKRKIPLRVRFKDHAVVYGSDGSVIFSKK